MNKKKKIAIIIILIFATIFIFSTISRASDILSGIYTGTNEDNYMDMANKIVGLVQIICYASAVIILLYKGVGFMSKAPEAKAEAKKELIAYAIGAFILFSIGSIIKIIADIAMNNLFTR